MGNFLRQFSIDTTPIAISSSLAIEGMHPESLNFGLEDDATAELEKPIRVSDTEMEPDIPDAMYQSDLFKEDDGLIVLESSLVGLSRLITHIRSSSGINGRMAMECKRLMPDFLPSLSIEHYTQEISKTHYKISLEEMSKGFIAMIVAAIAAGLWLIYRFIRWMVGSPVEESKSSPSSTTKKTSSDITTEVSSFSDSYRDDHRLIQKIEEETRDVVAEAEKTEEDIQSEKYAKPIILNGPGNIAIFRERAGTINEEKLKEFFKTKNNFIRIFSWEESLLQSSAGVRLMDKTVSRDDEVTLFQKWDTELRKVRRSIYDLLTKGDKSELMIMYNNIKNYYDDFVVDPEAYETGITFYLSSVKSILADLPSYERGSFTNKKSELKMRTTDEDGSQRMYTRSFGKTPAHYQEGSFSSKDMQGIELVNAKYEELVKTVDLRKLDIVRGMQGGSRLSIQEATAKFSEFWSKYDGVEEDNLVKINSFDEMFSIIKNTDFRVFVRIREELDVMLNYLSNSAKEMEEIEELITQIRSSFEMGGYERPLLNKISADLSHITMEFNRRNGYVIRVMSAFRKAFFDALNYGPRFIGFYNTIITRHVYQWRCILKYTEDLTDEERKEIKESIDYFSKKTAKINVNFGDIQTKINKLSKKK